jgi:hypothetical protein
MVEGRRRGALLHSHRFVSIVLELSPLLFASRVAEMIRSAVFCNVFRNLLPGYFRQALATAEMPATIIETTELRGDDLIQQFGLP